MRTLSALVAVVLASASLAAQAVGRMADLAIFDRSTGRELPVHWHEGRAYVVGKPGNEYQVVVRNRRGEDLLAVVAVDGVNVLTGQTASSEQGGYIVGARDRLDVKGWRKSLGEVASFYFTSLGDSYAARTDRPQHVGVIGVALFRRAVRLLGPEGGAQPVARPFRLVGRGPAREARRAPGAGTGSARHRPRATRGIARALCGVRARNARARGDDRDLLRQLPQPRGAGRAEPVCRSPRSATVSVGIRARSLALR